MSPSINRVALAVVVAAVSLLLAACGSDDGDGTSAAGSSSATGSAAVSVQDIDGTGVLVDSAGRALYSADQEQGGKILCTGECNTIWEPAMAAGAGSSSGDVEGLGTVKRPDGGEQLTYRGMPLYSFTEEGPGELTGDGFADTFDGTDFDWHAATVSGDSGSESSDDSSSGGYY
jgi:predicted lipoprotein with Yx(FWY)xxD motif